MRLVLDQGVPQDAAALLRSLGYGCMHVGEIGMSKAADEEILSFLAGKKCSNCNPRRGLSHDPGSLWGTRAFRDSYTVAGFGRTRSC